MFKSELGLTGINHTFQQETIQRFLPDTQASQVVRPKKKYQSTSFDQTFELVRLIEEENYTIKKAASTTGVNYSTAKNFLKKFKSACYLQSAPRILQQHHNIQQLLALSQLRPADKSEKSKLMRSSQLENELNKISIPRTLPVPCGTQNESQITGTQGYVGGEFSNYRSSQIIKEDFGKSIFPQSSKEDIIGKFENRTHEVFNFPNYNSTGLSLAEPKQSFLQQRPLLTVDNQTFFDFKIYTPYVLESTNQNFSKNVLKNHRIAKMPKQYLPNQIITRSGLRGELSDIQLLKRFKQK